MNKLLRPATRLLTRCIALGFVLALFSGQALAVCYQSGFEDEDGNLSHDGTCYTGEDSDSDWNDFFEAVWDGGTGPPYRHAVKVVNGWTANLFEDDEESNQDTAFSGGTKQDDSCASTKGGKAPNKDDLRRAYISSNTIGGDVFLNLAWIRIPQNSTSASAHIGFEFNQGDTLCDEGEPEGLVERVLGDLLFVYDFQGGDAEATISVRKWVDSGACEVGNSSPPCWGESIDLSVAGFAEARVNTELSVSDNLAAPFGGGVVPVTEDLGVIEFGEAGINLTDAEIFDPNVCLGFGRAFAVSRSSGNSAQAQMKDLVGPGDVNIANCGSVIIRKVTNPSTDTTTIFDYTTTGGLDPNTFTLTGGNKKDYGSTVFAGAYSVTETTKSGWDLTSLDCSASAITNGTTVTPSGATVNFDLKALDTVDCTYTNTARAALSVTKQVVNACDPNDPTSFTLFLDPNDPPGARQTATGGHDSKVSNGLLLPGNYLVGEDDPGGKYTASISGGGSDCSDGSVDLDPGDSVNCTVTNVRRPTIKIVKYVSDGGSETFDLLIDDGNNGSPVEKKAVAHTGMSDTVTVATSLTATTFGPVKLSETQSDDSAVAGNGWKNYWECNDQAKTTATDKDSIVIQELLSGETVTCTVTNIPVNLQSACTPAP